MRVIVSALPLLTCAVLVLSTAGSPAQPKPADKKPADKKPADKMDKPPVALSATDVSKIDGESLEQWGAKLSSIDPSLRDTALRVVPAFGPPAQKYLPRILRMMTDDPDLSVRVTAIRTASSSSVHDPDNKILTNLTQNLNQLMGHTDKVLRLQAVLAAGRLGPLAAACAGKLAEVLRIDQSAYEVRRAAAAALALVAAGDGKSGAGPEPKAIHALLGALGDTAFAVRADAVQSLIVLGPPADPAELDGERKSLVNRIPRETEGIQKMWLRVCLMRLDPAAVKTNMAALMKELTSPRLRVTAAECIGMMGADAKVAKAELQKGVNSADTPENVPYVMMCMWAVSQLKADAKDVLPDIQRWKMHKDDAVKTYATDAEKRILGQIK